MPTPIPASVILRASALAGLAIAVLDISGAFLLSTLRGGGPVRVLHAVASGFLGRDAYTGGATSAAIGAATHTGIALAVATFFAFAASRFQSLLDRPWLTGPLYGLGVYSVMHFIVLPLRFGRFPRFDLHGVLGQLGCHIFLVGLPAALITAAVFRRATRYG